MGMRIDWFRVVGDFLEDVCRRDDPRLSPAGKKFAQSFGQRGEIAGPFLPPRAWVDTTMHSENTPGKKA